MTQAKTYQAMQVSASGALALVEKTTPSPGPGEVLLQVEACGVCGADAADIAKAHANGVPRVPGHEVVGRIVALGVGTPSIWRLGQRVGVGRLGGHCHECIPCRQGRFNLCQNQPIVGNSCDGGYAGQMLARSTGLVAIPQELSAEDAAPILCAGIATFNALRHCGARAGDLVAIAGIGGLGHLAVQYAQRMGFRVAAIGRGNTLAADALALGAHHFVDYLQDDAAAALKRLGGAQAIITTLRDASRVSTLVSGLAPGGKLVILAPTTEPLSVAAGLLVGGERAIAGSLTGTPYETEQALDFSVLVNVTPRIEVMPLSRANEALQRMATGQARFRMVLTMTDA